MSSPRVKSGRIEAISDGVFAIALTLLVLDLKLPETEGPVTREAFSDLLRGQAPGFVAWLISFAVLVRLWILNHRLIEGAQEFTHLATVLNFVFLGVVSFIPFPTAMISNHHDQPLAVVVFAVTYVTAAVALAALWGELRKEPYSAEARAAKDAAIRWALVWIPAAGAVACGLAFIDTRYSLVAWIAILALGVSTHRRT